MVSNDLLKGTLKTIVLSLLEEKGRMYGYEITQEVERLTKGKIQLTCIRPCTSWRRIT